MIPPTIHPSTQGNAERRMFEVIRDAPDTDRWVCFHSLGLAHHPTKRQGEVDFVLLTRHGVFTLEVKGGRVLHENRVWYSVDKYDQRYKLKESPFKQAADAMFELERHIKRRFRGKVQSRTLFGFGVVMPDFEFGVESPEWDLHLVYDSRDTDKAFTSYVNRLAECHRHKQHAKKHPSLKPDAIDELADYLRADFDFIPSANLIIDGIRQQLDRLTLEQRDVLEVLETESRVIVHGGAGTGKTVLAVDAAKRLAAAGDRVLFVCFNKLLSARLANHVAAKNYEGEIVVRHVDDHFVKITKGTEFESKVNAAIDADKPKAFAIVVPEYAALVASDLDDDERFDALIIDEGQDFLTNPKLDALNEMLRGGFENGRWYVFLDKDQQAQVHGNFDPKAFARLTARGVQQRLWRNCRNTSPIAMQTALVCDTSRQVRTRVDGDPVDFRVYREPFGWLQDLEHIISELRREEVSPGRISVLFVRTPNDKDVLRRLEKMGLRRLAEADIPNLGTTGLEEITWATVSGFKGLENDVVIVVGVTNLDDDWYRSLAYAGMSRARTRLHVMIDEESDKKRREREKEWQDREKAETETML
jgi:ATP:corrinoid adenosyltransferase